MKLNLETLEIKKEGGFKMQDILELKAKIRKFLDKKDIEVQLQYFILKEIMDDIEEETVAVYNDDNEDLDEFDDDGYDTEDAEEDADQEYKAEDHQEEDQEEDPEIIEEDSEEDKDEPVKEIKVVQELKEGNTITVKKKPVVKPILLKKPKQKLPGMKELGDGEF